ncbi:hypothetical protein HDV01_007769 [Terramyces sp. JEL0728]|nr:hypothetical protein HDV01_007769 [Terramyces sp. JEL0728]
MSTENTTVRRKSLVDTPNLPVQKGHLRKRSATTYQKRPDLAANGSLTNLGSISVKGVDTKSFAILEKIQTGPYYKSGIKEASLQRFAAQISLGLSYLHNNFIIHRAINPDNLLLDPYGNILISNFSHAMSTKYPIILSDEDINTNCKSPEVLNGKQYQYSADWWSMGVTLYESTYGSDTNTFEFSFPKTNNLTQASVSESVHRETFIKGLLEIDPHKRIGNSYGGLGFEKDVKQHPWLSLIEWEALQAERSKVEANFQLSGSNSPYGSGEFLNKLLTKVKTNINNVAGSFSRLDLPQDVNMDHVKLLSSFMKDFSFENQDNEKLDNVPEDICLGLQFTLKDAIKEYIQLEEIENQLTAIQAQADKLEKEIHLLEAEIKGIENKLAYLHDKRIKNSPFAVESRLYEECEKQRRKMEAMNDDLLKYEGALNLVMQLVRAFSYKYSEISRKVTDPDDKFILGTQFSNFMIDTYSQAREIQPKIPKLPCLSCCKVLGNSKTLVGKIPQLKEYTREELHSAMNELLLLSTNLSQLVKYKRTRCNTVTELYQSKSNELELERRKILRGLALGIDRQRALRTSIDTISSSLDLPPAYVQLPSPTPSYDDDIPLCQLFNLSNKQA